MITKQVTTCSLNEKNIVTVYSLFKLGLGKKKIHTDVSSL